jgi:predicted RNA-binding protein with PUA-like domain
VGAFDRSREQRGQRFPLQQRAFSRYNPGMAQRYWLVKQEPADYAWAQFVADRRTAWTGVRNYAARNHLRAMAPGDLVLYYHSGEARQIVGVACVARAAYADPTATAGDWSAVDLQPVQPLAQPVTLAAVKADPALAGLALVRQSRLSVMPVEPAAFERILKLAATRLA